MMAAAPRDVDVLGVPITCFSSYEHATQSIVRRIRNRDKTLCIAINPEKVCFARDDAALRNIIRRAQIHICDGVGTAVAVKWITGWRIPRITGVGLFFKLMETAEQEGLGIFLLGAKPEVNEKAWRVLRDRHPKLRIAGRHDGYFKDANEVIRQINGSGADMLFAALGSPRQEKWLSRYLEVLNVPFCMGVGGSFDVLAGYVKRAPEFFQRTGTEFLYRLIREPHRWRRQLILPGFTARMLVEAITARGLKSFVSSREIRTIYGGAEGGAFASNRRSAEVRA